jgi:glycosyltransferase involved in cell wall biosynthesis
MLGDYFDIIRDSMHTNKTCLIVSYGPVPTPKYQKIEGGGMRCWGLAQGLHARGYAVTVGVNESFPLDVSVSEDIHLTNWREDTDFVSFINSFDAVIINYSMGGPMSYVVDHISDHVTLILDCYVPIYIEVSARDSEDKENEYKNYSVDIQHWNKALCRGDYFLCANEPQKHMYMGSLGALGIINPYSYKTARVFVVPFGVERSVDIPNKRNPYLELGIKKTDSILLWFGGLYPWFNILPLLDAVERISKDNKQFKFVIVGGKNPYNSHPDFLKQYEATREFAEKKKLINHVIYFVDWVDFQDRYNWYQHVKAVISINNVGEENSYSWRTRVMDFVGGELPMITNGGDPLSDSLIRVGAAIKLDAVDDMSLYDTSKGPNAISSRKRKSISGMLWSSLSIQS